MNKLNLEGQRFSKLVVLERVNSTSWKCECDCGNLTIVRTSSLRRSHTRSCGCLKKKMLPKGTSGLNALIRVYQNRAKKDLIPFDLSRDMLIKLFKGYCYYCGSSPSNVYICNKLSPASAENSKFIYNGIDRISNNYGYTWINCVSCCEICNYMKQRVTYDEFINHIKKLYNWLNL